MKILKDTWIRAAQMELCQFLLKVRDYPLTLLFQRQPVQLN